MLACEHGQSVENLRNDVGPTNETPVLLDTSGQGDLLTDLCAGGRGERETGGVSLHSDDLGTSSSRTNVDHEDFVLRQLGDLGLLAVGGLDTEQSSEEEVVDLDFGVDVGEMSTETEDEANETIGTAEGRVDAGTDTDETTGDGKLQVVVLGEQRDDSREDGLALDLALAVLGHDAGPDLDLVAQLQDTGQDGATSNTALELVDLGAGLVDVEGSDDDHVGLCGEVADGDGDLGDELLADGVDVELELGGDGDDGRAVGDGAADELEDGVVVGGGAVFPHQVDLVLQDDDVVELHDLDGGQVLAGLGLGARLVAGNQQQGGVHDGGARQHRAHENVVAGAVDEGDVALEAVGARAAVALAGRVDLLLALVGAVAGRARALGVVALVDLGVRVAELDGDVALELVLEADRLHAGDGLDHRRLAVRDVADGADVDRRLARDDLGRQRAEGGEVDCAWVRLLAAAC